MNFKSLYFMTMISSTLVSLPIYAVQNPMIFKNQRGSILELYRLADNKVEGYFTTAVASKACPDAIATKQPIVGYTVGNAITFSVVYPMCHSVLSITGNFSKNQTSIDTISILNLQSDDIIHEGPGARFIGHDSYKKID